MIAGETPSLQLNMFGIGMTNKAVKGIFVYSQRSVGNLRQT